MNIYEKSTQLLERIANSMYDRDPSTKGFFFTINEIQVTESWLNELLLEVKTQGQQTLGGQQYMENQINKEVLA